MKENDLISFMYGLWLDSEMPPIPDTTNEIIDSLINEFGTDAKIRDKIDTQCTSIHILGTNLGFNAGFKAAVRILTGKYFFEG